MSRQFLLVGLLAASMVVGATPAAAAVIEREHFSDTVDFSFSDCGFRLDVAGTSRGTLLVRVDKTGQAFLIKDTFHYRNVFTNPATGQWFVQSGHGILKDIKATQVNGTIYEFTAIQAGQPSVIEDAEGNVILRDRGVVRRTYLFDTLGDGMPSGNVIEETGVVVRGPHPSRSENFCAIAAELTGVTD